MKTHDASDYAGAPAASPGPLFDQPEPAPAASREGPFSRSKITPRPIEVCAANLIWQHKGRDNAISIRQLSEGLFGKDERAIKAIVADLIGVHKMRIGAVRGTSKSEAAGYFIVCDAEDARVGTQAYKAQLIAMARRLRILDPEGMPDLFGQLELEADDAKP